MKSEAILAVIGIGFLAACGPSVIVEEEDPGVAGTGGTTVQPTTTGSGGAVVGAGGAAMTTGGTGGTGNTMVTPGTCTQPATYAGPALMKGMWIDVTGSLTGAQHLWAVPQTDKILAGVMGQGLWAYSAAGNTWTQLKGTGAFNVSQVFFDSCNGERFWIAAQGGNGGVYYTEDGGATVKKLGTLTDVSGVSADLKNTNGQTIIAAKSYGWPWSDGKGSLSVSKDGGATWTDQTAAFTASKGSPFGFVHAIDDKTLIASAVLNGSWDGNNSKGGIWLTTDGGTTWAQSKWVDGPRCATHAWCGYGGWNQPMGEALVLKSGEIWWVNAWQNTYFSSTDRGAGWVDHWGDYSHSLAGGGGHAVEIPKALTAKPDASDPAIVWIDNNEGLMYFQPNKDGPNLSWWAKFLPNPVPVASQDKTDQLAFNSVASALFLSSGKGSGGKQFVWMYAF